MAVRKRVPGRHRGSMPVRMMTIRTREKAVAKMAHGAVIRAQTDQARIRAASQHLQNAQRAAGNLAYKHTQRELERRGVPLASQPRVNPRGAYLAKVKESLYKSLRDPNLSDAAKASRTATAVSTFYNRAYSESQLEIMSQVADENPQQKVTKIWTAEPDACDVCAELDGQEEDVTGTFDISDDTFGDGEACPAHPGCRCRIEINIS